MELQRGPPPRDRQEATQFPPMSNMHNSTNSTISRTRIWISKLLGARPLASVNGLLSPSQQGGLSFPRNPKVLVASLLSLIVRGIQHLIYLLEWFIEVLGHEPDRNGQSALDALGVKFMDPQKAGSAPCLGVLARSLRLNTPLPPAGAWQGAAACRGGADRHCPSHVH